MQGVEAPKPSVAVRGPHPPPGPARRGWAGAAAVQRQGRQRAEALAEGSVELAQAMVPLASALARGGGCRVSVCSAVMRGGVLVC